MNVSLVYNNKKLIGRCSKFAIEKVQGTSPFVMLENFEPKQPQLNENQQIVLEWLKERQLEFNERPSTTIYFLTIHYPYGLDDVAKAKKAFSKLNKPEETQVLEVFFRWAQEQEEE